MEYCVDCIYGGSSGGRGDGLLVMKGQTRISTYLTRCMDVQVQPVNDT